MDLEAYELVMLRRPADATPYDDATLERIQREHLAYHAELRAAGQVVTNGPLTDQPDESLRGLSFYRTGSLDEARRLAEADPAVKAGRLAVERHDLVLPGRHHAPPRPARIVAVARREANSGPPGHRPGTMVTMTTASIRLWWTA